MKKYKAKDLYNSINNNFTCPSCENDLRLLVSRILNELAIVRCQSCKKVFIIILPKIKKKSIYLDQWFVSNISDPDKMEYYEKLIHKLGVLTKKQRIFVVTSDVHALETSNIKQSDKKKTIWEKFNSLACGHIAKDTTDILLQQYKRILLKEKENYPWSDILDKNPHQWVSWPKVILTNNWRLRLHEKTDTPYEKVNELYRTILENQTNGINQKSSQLECFDYINKLWFEDILKSVDYYEKKSYLVTHPEQIDKSFFDHPGAPICSAFTAPLIELCTNYDKSLSHDDVIKLLKETDTLPKKINISSSLEAYKLFSALQANLNKTGVTKNKKKFSTKYGVSSQNDISHIASFSPYVDVLITDDNARERLKQSHIQAQLTDIQCCFYSHSNIREFEELLDKLLSSKENYEFKITRQLLIG